MDKTDFDQIIDAVRKELGATKPWRVARWDSIKADPQAAAVMCAVGYAAAKWAAPALHWIGAL